MLSFYDLLRLGISISGFGVRGLGSENSIHTFNYFCYNTSNNIVDNGFLL